MTLGLDFFDVLSRESSVSLFSLLLISPHYLGTALFLPAARSR